MATCVSPPRQAGRRGPCSRCSGQRNRRLFTTLRDADTGRPKRCRRHSLFQEVRSWIEEIFCLQRARRFCFQDARVGSGAGELVQRPVSPARKRP